jgi:hypothetical protein
MTTPLAERLFSEAFEVEVLEAAEEHPDLRTWSAAGKGKTKANPGGEDGAWWRANGPKMVQNWIDWRQAAKWVMWTTPDGEPAIELSIETDVSGVPLKMYIDRVMVPPKVGVPVIVDLKTGKRSPESDLQLGVYRYGIWRKYGIRIDWGAYWMAREGAMSELYPLARFTPGLLERMFAQFVKAKQAEIFLPHLTFRCRACSMRDYCAAYGGKKSHLDPDHESESES